MVGGEGFLVIEVGVKRPGICLGVVAPHVGVAFVYDIRRRYAAPVQAIHGKVLRARVHILDGVSEVGVERQSFGDVGLYKGVDAQVVVRDVLVGSLF